MRVRESVREKVCVESERKSQKERVRERARVRINKIDLDICV